MVDAEYERLAEARIARQGRMLGRLRKAIKPFADIALARDEDQFAPDMIVGVDLAITPSQVREAREAFHDLDSDFPAQPQEASDPEASLPTYGNIPWDQLGRDVMEATTARRSEYPFDPKFYPGHQSPGINFNSLARIVDKYRSTSPLSRPVRGDE